MKEETCSYIFLHTNFLSMHEGRSVEPLRTVWTPLTR